MEEVKQYLLDIGFDDAHLPELFNDDDKSIYTIPELIQAYTEHKLKLLGIHNVMCCSFCKEEIKPNEQEYMHKNGCGCMDELPQEDEEFERLDTGHTVTNGYPLE